MLSLLSAQISASRIASMLIWSHSLSNLIGEADFLGMKCVVAQLENFSFL